MTVKKKTAKTKAKTAKKPKPAKTAAPKKPKPPKVAPPSREHVIAVTPPSAAWWRALPRAVTLTRRAALAALDGGLAALSAKNPLRIAAETQGFEVSVVLTGDKAVRDLNRDYRHQDKATNVLSFPTEPLAWPLLGDVVVAHGVSADEATKEKKDLGAHLTHLVIHGVLHLLGYDHHDDKDATMMERLESKIMARLGLPDPYRDTPSSRVPPRR